MSSTTRIRMATRERKHRLDAREDAGASAFPRIVRFFETTDAPGSSCPHCGAEGRWILSFAVDDGRTLAAMRGCAKLFPVSRIATEELRLRTKLADYVRRGWNGLGQNDAEALAAIEDFYNGTRDERSALIIVDGAKARNVARYRR